MCCIDCATTTLSGCSRFAELFTELERPELLFLALLFHDTGKGLAGDNHVHGSLQLALAAVDRLGLSKEDAQIRRLSDRLTPGDVVDLAAARYLRSRDHPELAGKMETPERLKMLTLLTLADIKAVNPEALTPWKAENLWQLYIATANYFTRSVDEQRFRREGVHRAG